ncbi:MAG: ABC transporter permease [Pseudomonadota bacterium]
MTPPTPPAFTLDTSGGAAILRVTGDWLVTTIGALDDALRALPERTQPPALDVTDLGQLDTAGAFIIDRTLRQGCTFADPPLDLVGQHPIVEHLVGLARRSSMACEPASQPATGLYGLLDRTGRGAVALIDDTVDTLAFLGETIVVCAGLLIRPARLRWTAMVAVMEEAGLDAMPIVAFLSFFVGMVVAFIGATTLSEFGATIFTVELVGISVLREFGVILTAIILAGRTNSAFTAQIGAMKMRQEIDAMTTLGLKPMEVIVAPRVFAMLIMTPILAFVATLSGVFGGLVVSWLALDINPVVFLTRIRDFVPIENFWVGMSKAPIFGLVVALIGCRQGLHVGGSVQSLGSHTTKSVVQAIFTVIVIDAVFAIFYMELGL